MHQTSIFGAENEVSAFLIIQPAFFFLQKNSMHAFVNFQLDTQI